MLWFYIVVFDGTIWYHNARRAACFVIYCILYVKNLVK